MANGTPPEAIPGQKLSQALKQHRQLAFWYFQKKQNKECPFSKKLQSQWHTCRRVEDFHEVVANFESCP